jgi:ketosteroid isomerase-like protein
LHGKWQFQARYSVAMSEENVEAFQRGIEALNRRDIDSMLQEVDPDVSWRDAINEMFGGPATMYRGHDAVRGLFQDLYDSFAEIEVEYPDVRDLGEQMVAIGRIRTRGNESGAETDSPVASFIEWRHAKAVRVLTYLDPEEALEAAGLSE